MDISIKIKETEDLLKKLKKSKPRKQRKDMIDVEFRELIVNSDEEEPTEKAKKCRKEYFRNYMREYYHKNKDKINKRKYLCTICNIKTNNFSGHSKGMLHGLKKKLILLERENKELKTEIDGLKNEN